MVPETMNLLSVWEKAQPSVKEALGSAVYETWFSPLQIKEKSEETLVVETPDEFFKNWINFICGFASVNMTQSI